MGNREWAARVFLGWHFRRGNHWDDKGAFLYTPPDGKEWAFSDADLAEAVRVKWIEEWTDEVEAKEPTVGRALYLEGPLAFIAAVREVVE